MKALLALIIFYIPFWTVAQENLFSIYPDTACTPAVLPIFGIINDAQTYLWELDGAYYSEESIIDSIEFQVPGNHEIELTITTTSDQQVFQQLNLLTVFPGYPWWDEGFYDEIPNFYFTIHEISGPEIFRSIVVTASPPVQIPAMSLLDKDKIYLVKVWDQDVIEDDFLTSGPIAGYDDTDTVYNGAYQFSFTAADAPDTLSGTSHVFISQPYITYDGNVLSAYPGFESNTVINYQWYYNGNILEGATAQTLIPEEDGEYSVFIHTLYCDGSSLPFSWPAVSTAEVDEKPLMDLFPNPIAKGDMLQMSISDKLSNELVLEIYQATGELVYQQKNIVGSLSVNAPEVPGIYLICLRHQGKIMDCSKLIVY